MYRYRHIYSSYFFFFLLHCPCAFYRSRTICFRAGFRNTKARRPYPLRWSPFPSPRLFILVMPISGGPLVNLTFFIFIFIHIVNYNLHYKSPEIRPQYATACAQEFFLPSMNNISTGNLGPIIDYSIFTASVSKLVACGALSIFVTDV